MAGFATPRRAVVDTAGMASTSPLEHREGPTARLVPLLLVAAHPRLGMASAAGLGLGATLSGRPAREVGMVLLTALVGQCVLGWADDLLDRRRDTREGREDKPVAQGLLAPGDLGFALTCGVLLVVPLAMSHGLWAGSSYLGALLVAVGGGRLLGNGWLSWLPWAASYALYPAFLAYGGWAGQGLTTPPEISVTVLAALLGVCVHVLTSLPGLVADHEAGRRHLPLRIALRTGAPRLLWATGAAAAVVVGALLYAGSQVGLRQ